MFYIFKYKNKNKSIRMGRVLKKNPKTESKWKQMNHCIPNEYS